MVKACPVSIEKVDKYLLKSYAAMVIIFLGLFLWGFKMPFLFITLDFLIRVLWGLKYSPTCFVLRSLFGILHIRPSLINAGPKKFAAAVGLFFSIAISVSFILGYGRLADGLAVFFLIALLLEVVANYCLACKMQSLYLSLVHRLRQ